MSEEWGTPVSKEKIIARRNKLIEIAKVEAKPYTIWHETINENILDINYMIYEIERLYSIINETKKGLDKFYKEHSRLMWTEEDYIEFINCIDRELKGVDK